VNMHLSCHLTPGIGDLALNEPAESVERREPSIELIGSEICPKREGPRLPHTARIGLAADVAHVEARHSRADDKRIVPEPRALVKVSASEAPGGRSWMKRKPASVCELTGKLTDQSGSASGHDTPSVGLHRAPDQRRIRASLRAARHPRSRRGRSASPPTKVKPAECR
jgi:hypothetical protein